MNPERTTLNQEPETLNSERGIALVLAVLMTLALSALTASLMLVSKTETWSGMNYRMLAQARYGAEAGLHRTANYLLNSYTPPGGAADPIGVYDITQSPVMYNNAPVILSSVTAVPSNYPVATVVTGFQNGAKGSVGADTFRVAYGSYARLLSMRQITPLGSTTPTTVQTWEINGIGTIAGSRSATQEVSAILEQQIAPIYNYAAFASSGGCSALNFTGGATTDSFDSNNITMKNGNVQTDSAAGNPPAGNVGTNGNLSEVGSATVNGNLSTPRSGVGNCSAGNVTAWTASGNGKVTGSIIELPQSVTYPTPVIPAPGSTNISLSSSTSQTLTGSGTPPTANYGDISASGQSTIHLVSGTTYNINSISITGGASLVIDPVPGTGPGSNPPVAAQYAPVNINVTGNSQATPIDFTGGTIENGSGGQPRAPSLLHFLYAGTGQVVLTGGAHCSALLDAPNASVKFTGGAQWYGSVIASQVTETGGASIVFDRQLINQFWMVGNPTLTSFTWKKY